ncbi:uncharacterized protein LOC143860911 [Tasmannia lanceolata]|uniref:uncharacterized protein LOC143860911 n=1 Tax=Tasmannia lanceolata TaxID=3420 RepID=UPI0040647769
MKEVPFDVVGEHTILVDSDIKRLRMKYHVPSSVSLRIPKPSQWACDEYAGLSVYEDMFRAGFRFPVHEFFVRVLNYYGVSPAQIVPNGWRSMVGFAFLVWKLGKRLSVDVFRACFELRPLSKGSWWYYFIHRTKTKVIDKLPSSIKKWKNKYVFASLRNKEEVWGFEWKWSPQEPKGKNGAPVLDAEDEATFQAIDDAIPITPADLVIEANLVKAGLGLTAPKAVFLPRTPVIKPVVIRPLSANLAKAGAADAELSGIQLESSPVDIRKMVKASKEPQQLKTVAKKETAFVIEDSDDEKREKEKKEGKKMKQVVKETEEERERKEKEKESKKRPGDTGLADSRAPKGPRETLLAGESSTAPALRKTSDLNMKGGNGTMDCIKEEALRLKGMTEEMIRSWDYIGARDKLIEAKQLFPTLENVSQMLTVCDILCAADKSFESYGKDWYFILQLNPNDEEAVIRARHHELFNHLEPIKDKFPGAKSALEFIDKAMSVLCDREKRSTFDAKRKASCKSPGRAHFETTSSKNKYMDGEPTPILSKRLRHSDDGNGDLSENKMARSYSLIASSEELSQSEIISKKLLSKSGSGHDDSNDSQCSFSKSEKGPLPTKSVMHNWINRMILERGSTRSNYIKQWCDQLQLDCKCLPMEKEWVEQSHQLEQWYATGMFNQVLEKETVKNQYPIFEVWVQHPHFKNLEMVEGPAWQRKATEYGLWHQFINVCVAAAKMGKKVSIEEISVVENEAQVLKEAGFDVGLVMAKLRFIRVLLGIVVAAREEKERRDTEYMKMCKAEAEALGKPSEVKRLEAELAKARAEVVTTEAKLEEAQRAANEFHAKLEESNAQREDMSDFIQYLESCM